MSITFLISAWLLSWFGFDEIAIKAVNELFSKQLTVVSYYFIAFVIGLLVDLVLIVKSN